jgi:Domain of unknown function (DUF4397)
MKKIKYVSAVFLLITALYSCEKKYEILGTYNSNLSDKANIKLINLSAGSLRNTLTINNQVVAPATVTAYLGTFPQLNSYAITNPGNVSILVRDTLLTSTQPAVTTGGPCAPGAYYTVFTYDTLNRAKALMVNDNLLTPSDSSISVRFANFFYSPNPVPSVSVFSWRANGNIATNVVVNTVTSFQTHLFRTDTLYFRTNATPSIEVGKVFYSGFTSKRNYTFAMRGGIGNTTGAGIRGISVYTHN